jgi:ketosteroid isomerase-like protein
MTESTILTLEKQAMERWRSGDPWGFVELCAEDVTYVDPNLTSPIFGLEKYQEYMRPVIGQIRYERSGFIEPKVVQIGDAALLTYNYRSVGLTDQGEIRFQTPWNVTEVYFRRANRWQIVHGHFSYEIHKLPEALEIPLPVQMSAQNHDGLLGELLGLERKAMERWRKGDPWGFIDISASDVTYFDTGTPQRINGREALSAEYAQREGKIFSDAMDFIDPQVQVCGDMAVLFYRYLTTHLDTDGSVARRTPWNCTEVYARRVGEWKIIHTHWSFIGGVRA